MTFKSNSAFLWKLIAIIVLVMAVGIAVAGAAEPLPERPIVPIATSSSPIAGSKIVLKAAVNSDSSSKRVYDADDWTVVQWQAVNGTWYDVDGWQGNFFYDADLDKDHWQVEWWVGSENYGKQNFRFVIYANQSREKVKQTSSIFDLPETRGIITSITVN